jgi:UDP-N-acetylmuramate dehydrogenase
MRPATDVALAPLCTLAVGGPARYFAAARTESDLSAALEWAQVRSIPVYVLGGGSNVVIADSGVDGLVIHVIIGGVERSRDGNRAMYRVGAGEPWDAFVAATVAESDAGLECLSGIPGLVGGTPVQNVGAYGQEVATTITHVHMVDRASRSAIQFDNAACGFGYRASRFKQADAGRYIVSGVTFALAHGGNPTVRYADVVSELSARGNSTPSLVDVRDGVLAIRRRKGMLLEADNAARRSCGSFFVNPVTTRAVLDRVREVAGADVVPYYDVDEALVKIPAAWLIEHSGFPKGTTRGTVGISPYQAQAIINRGDATAADVVALAGAVKRAVWNVFGIGIVPEPVLMGFAPSPELRFLLSPNPGR